MRCKYDGLRLGPGDTSERDGLLIHVDAKGEPLRPPHEVIEGRLLSEEGGEFALPLDVAIPDVVTE